jgi:hypothetical protein
MYDYKGRGRILLLLAILGYFNKLVGLNDPEYIKTRNIHVINCSTGESKFYWLNNVRLSAAMHISVKC